MLGRKKPDKKELSTEASDRIIEEAVHVKASDIHIDPEKDITRVRFRINGVLHVMEDLPKKLHAEILGRVKALSGVDIVERQLPQEGHLEIMIDGSVRSLRIATFPTVYGEALAMRLLNRENALIPLENLGFGEDQYKFVSSLIHSPYGVVLVTGPSNSGKTTLLYSILNKLRSPEVNIITVEDPIELQMVGIRQTQVFEKVGFTFARAMRSILRQDPDVVMLGEIRDSDTIQTATQASLAGRLVFGTFHTFDVPALIMRLLEMGIPISVLGHAFLGVVSTRLLRRLCHACEESYAPSSFEQKIMAGYNINELKQGKGCELCYNSGYSELMLIAEVVRFDDALRSCILERKSAYEINRVVRQSGAKSLWEVAMERVRAGETTIKETIRVVGLPQQ